MATAEDELDARCKRFSDEILRDADRQPARPCSVTVTWAQSLDGRIASNVGHPRLMLSGKESMQMTFWLRSMHDAVLVTHATLAADDSQLTVRNLPSEAMSRQPRAVVLDPDLQTSLDRRLFDNNRRPIFVCRKSRDPPFEYRRAALEEKGALICMVDEDNEGRIPLDVLFDTLSTKYNIKSVLVEPGLRFLIRLLECPQLLHALVVTVAPKLIGSQGRAPSFDLAAAIPTLPIATMTVGHDVVMGMKVLQGETSET